VVYNATSLDGNNLSLSKLARFLFEIRDGREQLWDEKIEWTLVLALWIFTVTVHVWSGKTLHVQTWDKTGLITTIPSIHLESLTLPLIVTKAQ
jgi:hypothetical protein